FRTPPRPSLLPYTTLFRSPRPARSRSRRTAAAKEPRHDRLETCLLRRVPRLLPVGRAVRRGLGRPLDPLAGGAGGGGGPCPAGRSEEHTSELQSRENLVCR